MPPPLTGFTATTFEDVIKDAGILYADIDGVGAGGPVLLGASQDGFTWDPGKEWGEMEFDGKRAPIVGGHEIIGFQSMISGTMLEFSDAQIPVYEAGATKVAGPPIVFTPKPAGELLVQGDYVKDLWLFLRRGAAGYMKIALPFALCTKYSLVSKDKEVAKVAVEFLACNLPATIGIAPYKISQEAALPA